MATPTPPTPKDFLGKIKEKVLTLDCSNIRCKNTGIGRSNITCARCETLELVEAAIHAATNP